MKITDLLPDAGRPIAYFPGLRRIAGSTNATLLLCQLIYWHGKQRDPAGWIMKRTLSGARIEDDAEAETLGAEVGLSSAQLRRARQQLIRKGFVKARHDRPTHLTYFRLDFAAIRSAWEAIRGRERMSKRTLPNVKTSIRERAKRHPLNGTYIDYAETTAERLSATPTVPTIDAAQLPLTPLEALQHPMIQLFQEVCGRIPGMRDYAVVIELMRHFHDLRSGQTAPFLKTFWLAWSGRRRSSDGRPYDQGSLAWLAEWAMNGHIPPTLGGSDDTRHARPTRDGQEQPSARADQPLSEEDTAAAGRINTRRRKASVPTLQ